jgi:hypothetical protein
MACNIIDELIRLLESELLVVRCSCENLPDQAVPRLCEASLGFKRRSVLNYDTGHKALMPGVTVSESGHTRGLVILYPGILERQTRLKATVCASKGKTRTRARISRRHPLSWYFRQLFSHAERPAQHFHAHTNSKHATICIRTPASRPKLQY